MQEAARGDTKNAAHRFSPDARAGAPQRTGKFLRRRAPFRANLAVPFARISRLSFNCRFSRGSLVSFSHSSALGTSQRFAAVGFGALNPVVDRVHRGLELLGELIRVRPMPASGSVSAGISANRQGDYGHRESP